MEDEKILDTNLNYDNEVSDAKLYNDRSMTLATFLGGPLAGGYIMAKNFKALDEPGKIATTWAIAIFSLIVVMALAFAIPESVHIPNLLFPIIMSAIAGYVFKSTQGEQVKKHSENGGGIFSVWRAVALIAVVIMLAIGVLFYVGLDLFGYA